MKHSGRFGLLLLFLCFIAVYSGPASENVTGKKKVELINKDDNTVWLCEEVENKDDSKPAMRMCYPQNEEKDDKEKTKSAPVTNSDKTKKENGPTVTPENNSDKTKKKGDPNITPAIADSDHKDMCRYTIRISDNQGRCDVKTSGDLQAKPGIKGDKENKPEKGERGEKGPKGETGKGGDKGEKGGTLNVGTHYLICKGDDPPKDIHNEGKKIDVLCDKTNQAKCLNVTANTYEYQLSGTDFWLSKDGNFSIAKLYGLTPSKLNFLMEISDEVSLKIIVHINGKIDLEKSLKILLWDHHLISATSTPESPTHYKIDENDCKDSNDTTAWCKAAITLKTLPTLFRDFLFQNISPEEVQRVKIEIKEVCFTVK